MKTIIILFIGLIFTIKIQAQSTVTTSTLIVKGNCGECKDRIENAVDIKGVKNSSWSEDTKILTVTYDTKKVTLEQVKKAIAAVGHETTDEKADEKAYAKLPSCCQYKTKECKK